MTQACPVIRGGRIVPTIIQGRCAQDHTNISTGGKACESTPIMYHTLHKCSFFCSCFMFSKIICNTIQCNLSFDSTYFWKILSHELWFKGTKVWVTIVQQLNKSYRSQLAVQEATLYNIGCSICCRHKLMHDCAS